jgi:hypothetical protein
MRKLLRIKFTDFWPTFQQSNHCSDNYFFNLLQKRFSLELTDKPEVLMYSVFGREHYKYRCFKIFYTGENTRPNFAECDFAFSFDHLNREDHYRLPLYVLHLESPDLLIKKQLDIDGIIRQKTKFCNFVYSNGTALKRIHFFDRLSKYKRIDSAGRVLNNQGNCLGWGEANKLNFLNNYKFTIAFENSEYPGYTTEKLVQPMMVNSLPIYWGNKLIAHDFNTKSFLSYYDYPDEDTLIERIIEIDQNDDLYREYLLEPYYHNNRVNPSIEPENILNQFEEIFRQIHS